MKNLLVRILLVAVIASAGGMLLTACGDDKPADKIDKAADKVKDATDKGADKAKDAANKAKDAADDMLK